VISIEVICKKNIQQRLRTVTLGKISTAALGTVPNLQRGEETVCAERNNKCFFIVVPPQLVMSLDLALCGFKGLSRQCRVAQRNHGEVSYGL
jgi:hypothetical protein